MDTGIRSPTSCCIWWRIWASSEDRIFPFASCAQHNCWPSNSAGLLHRNLTSSLFPSSCPTLKDPATVVGTENFCRWHISLFHWTGKLRSTGIPSTVLLYVAYRGAASVRYITKSNRELPSLIIWSLSVAYIGSYDKMRSFRWDGAWLFKTFCVRISI